MNDIEIKKFMAEELNNGVSLSNIQDQIAEKFGVKYTFLEMRMLAAELEDIDWQKLDPATPKKEEKIEPQPQPGDGVTRVTRNTVVRPGAVASGSVSFGSGASAEWLLDQYGRLSLDNEVGTPTEDDVKAFQDELRKMFANGL